MEGLSYMVTLSHKPHHTPEAGAVSTALEQVQHGSGHMTTHTISKNSAGTKEVWIHAREQTMVLIINNLATTTLAQAGRSWEACHPACLHT
jgi:hypothetical protein